MAEKLRAHPSIQSKLAIRAATEGLGLSIVAYGCPGDDAAVIPRGDGYDLLAGEGFIPAFVHDDPWFAGWCGVMVNVSDIAAMGGRPTAALNQIWAPDAESAADMLQGLRDASAAYGVPLVGGHTNFAARDLSLAVSITGQAHTLISSFTARPGQTLIAAIDYRGRYVNFDNYCAALDAPAARLRADLALLPELSEAGLVSAGKDISQGGIVGTALMLAEMSGSGIEIDVDAIEPPPGIRLERWLRSFPSFGFLLAVDPVNAAAVADVFSARDIRVATIGEVTSGSRVELISGGARAVFWDHATTPYLGLAHSEEHAHA
ncbi:MAG: sll0787 family AIR synthase-like protein [Pseudomonadota bacterium]